MSAKVAVICLCYNHEKYVEEAMKSVLAQSYPSELIVIDDASADNSVRKIKNFIKEKSANQIKTIFLDSNIGNCKAFNKALNLTDADYIIDLAADDILLSKRVEAGVNNLEQNPEVAINFANANYINEKGEFVKPHYSVDEKGQSKELVPQGELFHQILERYFICPPSIMFRSTFLKAIEGYDEELAYEDFDVMLRLSRKHPFSYTDKILVEKRLLASSMSTKQYKKDNRQLHSTLKICRKAYRMIQNKSEKKALLRRIAYESKQAFMNKRLILLAAFINLGVKTILQK